MALNNIDQLFNNIPDEYKFDIIGSYLEYKKTGSLSAYNGCRFYFILLLKQLLIQNENLEFNGLIENNGRIMQYLFNECKMFDFYIILHYQN